MSLPKLRDIPFYQGMQLSPPLNAELVFNEDSNPTDITSYPPETLIFFQYSIIQTL